MRKKNIFQIRNYIKDFNKIMAQDDSSNKRWILRKFIKRIDIINHKWADVHFQIPILREKELAKSGKEPSLIDLTDFTMCKVHAGDGTDTDYIVYEYIKRISSKKNIEIS